MRRILLVFLISAAFVPIAFSQNNGTINVLDQGYQSVFSKPQEALKVAEYVRGHGTDEQKNQAVFLSALANYATGNLDVAMQKAFEARQQAAKSNFENTFRESSLLIAELLHFLQLKSQSVNYLSEISIDSSNSYHSYFSENLKKYTDVPAQAIKSTRSNIFENQLFADHTLEQVTLSLSRDSAISILENRTHLLQPNQPKSLWDAKALMHLAGLYFLNQNYSKADNALDTALQIAETLENPFLLVDIHRSLAAIYLAQNQHQQFHFHNQQAFKYHNIAESVENSLANTAYQLISTEQEQKLETIRRRHIMWLAITFGFALALGAAIIFSRYRNRKTLTTYKTFLTFLQAQQENKGTIKAPQEISEPRVSGLLEESEKAILEGLNRFELTNKFTSKDMSLGKLAAQLNTNTKYLSEVINRKKGKNFNAYINTLRVNYIAAKIKTDPRYLNYKVSYLAEEAGFSSHSSFTTVFKSIVGISPIAFVHFVKSQNVLPS